MIPEPVLLILASAAVTTLGVCIVLGFGHWLESRAALRRCAERRALAEIEIATMLALKAAPEKPVSELTKKIVPLRPDSA